MPHINHIVTHEYEPTFHAASVAGMFDIPVSQKLTKEWDINIPIEEKEWGIGLIVGASGSGKTTIADLLYPGKIHKGFKWQASCLLDDFPRECEVRNITEILSKVGFSSPPQWLLPYEKLSNGQKFRVELARCLLEYQDIFIYDEFSSFVDRQVAKISTHAFQKSVRKLNRKFIAVTCHADIEEWLQPDWVLDISTGEFKWGCLRRPQIEFKICRISSSAWQLFKSHHYLSADLNKSAVCFGGFINDKLVVFDSWLPFFGKLKNSAKARQNHRRVVLPDYQGLGLGSIILNQMAEYWNSLGYRAFISTSHPAEINKLTKSSNWILKRQGRTSKSGGEKSLAISKTRAVDRFTCGFEFRSVKI